MTKEKIVLKIGGSLLFHNDGKINKNHIIEFRNCIKSFSDSYEFIIVTGGGIIAREFIRTVRVLRNNESLCDLFGIEVSRINARLIAASLGNLAYPKVPKSWDELAIASESQKIIVIGGFQPGQSTTSVALEVSEFVEASKTIILTDVEGIYDKDPKKFKNAKLISEIEAEHLKRIILNKDLSSQASAGEYRIFDFVSLQILLRSEIPLYIISGKDFIPFQKIINGKDSFKGTRIMF